MSTLFKLATSVILINNCVLFKLGGDHKKLPFIALTLEAILTHVIPASIEYCKLIKETWTELLNVIACCVQLFIDPEFKLVNANSGADDEIVNERLEASDLHDKL